VSVSPNAKSSMSSSSSVASSVILSKSSFLKIIWQVEQDNVPSHAPLNIKKEIKYVDTTENVLICNISVSNDV